MDGIIKWCKDFSNYFFRADDDVLTPEQLTEKRQKILKSHNMYRGKHGVPELQLDDEVRNTF